MSKDITVRTLLRMKEAGEHIAMLTAYDYPTARLLAESGVHILLVGDSLGNVVQGQPSTLPVTLDHMVYHTQMVARAVTSLPEGTARPLVVTDLPFLTYQVSPEEALRSAGRILQEGGAQAVKLEGGAEVAPTVARLVAAGIPVMAHIGFTPQSVHALGGYAVQGKTLEQAKRLLADAKALEAAGAFAVVLELVPAEVAQAVTERLRIPTIGIGAGPHCDGQVLVFHDFCGYSPGRVPRHNKRYAHLAEVIAQAAKSYVAEVQAGEFPGPAQTVRLDPAEAARWQQWLNEEGRA
ncbi:3-methyl-2-oxobutanoate hydroxymethyltransferase [Alicyclobacillus cellulosilyticus]|uniref:3-methyl-2-oxobutanoate hydroxymethyltransferase n=1 Tax=Alicyclobacillus cellulosilyticus TaxID=1003997 RepID=A0A917K8L3_9BACL|nr:3-methyl-2-oxobutanoate hydroxymethyltransferase [Alicyclobacillus cellulosilyticus]GGJ05057.1 3-methyl-2-oxobutanoate hydroxymethyltransferase [Alicyclobacillus cellulosilyticus]